MLTTLILCLAQLGAAATDTPSKPAGIQWTFTTNVGPFVSADLAQHATLAWGVNESPFAWHEGGGVNRLFSRFDEGVPNSLWIEGKIEIPMAADAAAEGGLCAAIARRQVGTISEYVYTLRVGTATGPAWSFDYPHLTTGRTRVGVSRDGTRIVAAFLRPETEALDVFVFDADSAVPCHSWSTAGGALWAMDICEDARRVAFSVQNRVAVFELSSGALLYEEALPFFASAAMSISGDGRTLAYFTNTIGIRVLRWNGSEYATLFVQPVPGSVQRLALSRRGERLAWGVSFFTYPEPTTEVWTQCLDVERQALTMTEVTSSSGNLPNYQVDVEIDDAGTILAVAHAGDEPDLSAEVRVFRFDQDEPLFTLNLPGSADDVDVSTDGRWVLAGSRERHFSGGAGGGRLDLIHLGGDDLALSNPPQLGGEVTWTVWGEPGQVAWLLIGPGVRSTPLDLGPSGFFWLEPPVRHFPLGTISSDGGARVAKFLPDSVSLLGTTQYVQAGFLPDTAFGTTWIPLVMLP